MVYTAPVEATAEYLKRLVDRARSPHLFLSVYMPEGQEVTTTEALRLRLAALLDGVEEGLEGTSWEEPFQAERTLVEDYALTLRPGGPGLAVLSSREAREWHALWLPMRVEEHVRFGCGAYVLPLLDVLDEFEPVAWPWWGGTGHVSWSYPRASSPRRSGASALRCQAGMAGVAGRPIPPRTTSATYWSTSMST